MSSEIDFLSDGSLQIADPHAIDMSGVQDRDGGSFDVVDVDVGWRVPGGRGGPAVARPPRGRADRRLAVPADGFGFQDDGSFNPGHMHRDDIARHDSTNPSCCGGCQMGWECADSPESRTSLQIPVDRKFALSSLRGIRSEYAPGDRQRKEARYEVPWVTWITDGGDSWVTGGGSCGGSGCSDRDPLYPPADSCCCVDGLEVKPGFPPGTGADEIKARTPLNEGGAPKHSPFHANAQLSYKNEPGGPCTWEYFEYGDLGGGVPVGFDSWHDSEWNPAHSASERGRTVADKFEGDQEAQPDSLPLSDSPAGPDGLELVVFLRINSGCPSCKSCCAVFMFTYGKNNPKVQMKGPVCDAACELPRSALVFPMSAELLTNPNAAVSYRVALSALEIWDSVERDISVVVDARVD